jgi:hypothetical protein
MPKAQDCCMTCPCNPRTREKMVTVISVTPNPTIAGFGTSP